MSITRTFTAIALAAATTALTTTTLTIATAHAGGAPALGTVTVDRQVRLTADSVTLHGTYVCSVPDQGVATGPGLLGFEIVGRSGPATSGSVAVVCDGATRAWTITAPAGSLGPGRATALSYLEVCDSAGNCPRNGFESLVQIRRG